MRGSSRDAGRRTGRRRNARGAGAALVAGVVVGGVVAVGAVGGVGGVGVTEAVAQASGTQGVEVSRGSGHASPYRVTSAELAGGLYQMAYSERHDTVWATSTGGPTQSRLLAVDPGSLKVERSYAPPVTDPATGAVRAVFGVAVDDRHDTVWTTDTLDHSVSVYSQRTGRHLATLDDVAHAREIVVDEARNRAYASSVDDGSVVVFDTRTFEEVRRVRVEGSSPTGLGLDERTGTVHAADLSGGRLITVPARGSGEPRVIPLEKGVTPIDVTVDRSGRTAYVADQAGGRLVVVDMRSGRTERTVATGGGTKAVAADPRTGLVYVGARETGTTTVVDPADGTVVARLATGEKTNHVITTRQGAFAVDKRTPWEDAGAGQDSIHRITTRHLF